jgi:hypothetical protein
MRAPFIAALFGAALLPAVMVTPVAAQPATVARPIAQISVTFRLQVAGQPANGETFWVAYGPLAGRFGLFQLHSAGGGWFHATRQLTADGRTAIAYLAGHGVVRTRYGPAPGSPVVTIERFGPMLLRELQLHVVYWHVPVG